MKIKYLSMLLLFALLGCHSAFARGAVKVNLAGEGGSRDFELSESLMLTFSNPAGVMYVDTGAGTPDGFALKNVESITFSTTPAAVEPPLAGEAGIRLRNNPVQDDLCFAGAPAEPCELCVYSIQGALLLKIARWQGQTVDVGNLAPGLYILHINNKSFKFIKK